MSAVYELIKRYITKSLDVGVFLYVAAGPRPLNHPDLLSKEGFESFGKDCASSKMVLIPIDQLVSIKTLKEICSSTQRGDCRLSCVHTKQLYKVDQLFVEAFSKVLDEDLLFLNLGKFNLVRDVEDKHIVSSLDVSYVAFDLT